ncbi:MAG: GNAT family N-acetyltransferase [Flavobacteriales bacterium]
MFHIRPATPTDLPAVHQLIEQLEECSIPFEEFAPVYLRNCAMQDIYYFVGEENGTIVGFVSLHIQYLLHHFAPVAEVQEICISDTCRGKGYGKMLLDHVTQVARERDCDLIELCTNKKRTDAHRFYDREGWKQSHFKYTYPFRKGYL